MAITETMITTVLLRRGSGVEDCHKRIKKQFLKGESATENIAFLKKEFGIGGASPVLSYAPLNEWHDGKGIHLHRVDKLGTDEAHEEKLDLTWSEVETRYRRLIDSGVYDITYDSMKLYRIINTLKL